MRTAAANLVMSSDLCAAAEITHRQLDYWCRHGILDCGIVSGGSGVHRRFPPIEVDVARVLRVLSAAGIPPTGPLGRQAAAQVRLGGRIVHVEDGPLTVEVAV